MFHKIKINFQSVKNVIKILIINIKSFKNANKNNENKNKIERDNKKDKGKYY